MRLLGVALALSAVSILVYTGAEVMVLAAAVAHGVPAGELRADRLAGRAGRHVLVARWLPGGLKALPVDMLRQLSLSAVVLMALGAGPGPCWACWAWTRRSRPRCAFREFPIWRISLAGAVATGFCIVGLLQKPARALATPLASGALALTMLAAAWIFRWVVFMSVQGVPKYGAGCTCTTCPGAATGCWAWRACWSVRGAGGGGDLRAGPVPGPRPRRVGLSRQQD